MDEHHEMQPRGWWFPIEIVDLLKNGTINLAEFALLGHINSLVSKDKGCFASNAYFAKQMRCTLRGVENLMTGLRKKKLVRTLAFNGRQRVIETCFSRVDFKSRSTEICGAAPQKNVDIVLPPKGGNEFNNSPAKAGRGSKGTNMVFFPEPETSTIPENYKVLAAQLAKAVQDKAQVQKRYSLVAWAKELYKMERVHKITYARIVRVLEWYCQHIREQYIPLALSAKGFSEKFIAIEAAMSRASGGQVVEVDKEAEDIHRMLKRKYWPKGSDQHLLQSVQRSLNEHRKLRAAVLTMVRQHHKKKYASGTALQRREAYLLEYIKSKLGDSATFILSWYDEIHNRVGDWDMWSGDLKSFEFRRESATFIRMLHEWTRSYGQTVAQLAKLMEQIDAHRKA